MCGIVGFSYTNSSGYCNSEIVSRMSEALAHRGPDSQGIWVDKQARIALGHRRLAIVDLSVAGHQPMSSVSGRYMMVFNGEIYNHYSIREKLNEDPSYWRGASDTETLLAAVDRFGITETIQMVSGMYAIAIYDRHEDTISLIRDRLGEKPLYYGLFGGHSNVCFCFASEISAMKKHPAFSNTINDGAVAEYLRFGCIGGVKSIYKGILKVQPGEIVKFKVRKSAFERSQYWSVRNAISKIDKGNSLVEDECIEELHTLMGESIKRQAVADVPVGAFLSGGVDSSIIVAMMQQQSSRPINTFSIGFRDSDFNEADSARILSKHLGTCHHELLVSHNDVIDVIERLARINDEPFADPSQIPTFLVAKMARQSVTVALSGDGGDELFGGYSRHLSVLTYWRYIKLLPSSSRKVVFNLISQYPNRLLLEKLAPIIIGKNCGDYIYKVEKALDVLSAMNLAEFYGGLCSHWPVDAIGRQERCGASTNSYVEQHLIEGLNDIDQMLNLDLTTYLPDDILYKVDRAAMAVNLETRIPFLDHHLVEFAVKLPNRFKIRMHKGKYVTKWILRKMAAKYCGVNLMHKPKQGFEMPIRSWLRGPLKSWADDLIRSDDIYKTGLIDKKMVLDRWEEHLSGRRNWQKPIWNILAIQQWMRNL